MSEQLIIAIISSGGAVAVAILALLVNNHQIDKRFEQIDKRFEQMDKRFDQVREDLGAIRTALELLVGKVADMDTRLAVLEDRENRS